jgi:hypothetical protein
MSTNGSLRDKNWWADLGKILSRPGDIVAFGIDGLSDTNHLYRINSSFDKIIENAKSFISSGGNARWDFLVFEHNQHQIDAARALAHDLGFRSFAVKRTTRFISGYEYKSGQNRAGTPVHDKKTGDLQYWIKTPTIEKAEGLDQFNRIIGKYGSWNNYVDKTPISCIYQRAHGIFIDFRARVWPCCWLGAPDLFVDKNNLQRLTLEKALSKYAPDFNSLEKKTLREVLNHPWFVKDLVESWRRSTRDDNPKLVTCGRTCGSEFNFTSATGSNIQDKNLDNSLVQQNL